MTKPYQYSTVSTLLCILLLLFSVPSSVFADEEVMGGTQAPEVMGGTQVVPFSIDNPLKYDTLDKFITAIMGLVLQIMTPVIALLIIWTGFLFVKARGKPEEITKAKQAFLWVVIGAAIMLGAFVLKSAIEGTVGQLGSESAMYPLIHV